MVQVSQNVTQAAQDRDHLSSGLWSASFGGKGCVGFSTVTASGPGTFTTRVTVLNKDARGLQSASHGSFQACRLSPCQGSHPLWFYVIVQATLKQ